jgi:hypothetical protein
MADSFISLQGSVESKFDDGKKEVIIDVSLGQQVSEMLKLLNMQQIDVTQATLEPPRGATSTNQQSSVTGKTTLWNENTVDIKLDFTETGQEPVVTLAATAPLLNLSALGNIMPMDAKDAVVLKQINIEQVQMSANASAQGGQMVVSGSMPDWSPPGMNGISITKPQVQVRIQSSTDDLGQYSFELNGTIKLKTIEIPVVIDVPLGIGAWRVNIVPPGIALPSLADLLELVGGADIISSLPEEVGTMTAFTLASMTIQFDPKGPVWQGIDFAITSSNVWNIAPKLSVEQIALHLYIRPNAQSTQGTPVFFTGNVFGMVKIGSLDMTISIPVPIAGPLVLEAYPNQALPGLGELATLIDADFAAALPASMDTLGSMILNYLQIQFDLSKRQLTSFGFNVMSAEEWVIIPDYLSLEDLRFRLDATQSNGNWGITGLVAGGITVEDVRVSVALERSNPIGGWRLRLADALSIPGIGHLVNLMGGDDVSRFLPAGMEGNVGALTVYNFSMDFGGTAHALASLSLGVQTANEWEFLPGYLSIADLDVLLQINQPTSTALRQVTGSIRGAVDIGDIAVWMQATKTSAVTPWQFAAELPPGESVTLSSLVGVLLPARLALPDEIPDLSFSDLNLSVTPQTGAFDLTAKCMAAWELPFGVSGLSVSTADLSLHRSPTVGGSGNQITCALKLHCAGPTSIVDGLVFKGMDLTFDLNQQTQSWLLSGAVAASVFGADFTLAASLDQTPTMRTITLQATETASTPWLSLGGAGSLDGKELSIVISKALQPAVGAATSGVSLQASSAYTWSVLATGDLTLTNVFTLSGTLALAETNNSVSLAFKLTNAQADISLPEPLPGVKVHLGLEYLTIVGTTDSQGKRSWAFDTAVDVWFSGLTARIQAIAPSDAARAAGHFKADSHEVMVSVDRLVQSQEFKFPTTKVDSRTLDLGTAMVEASNLRLRLGSSITLSTDFAIGIPQELNNLFGTKGEGSPAVQFFNTYQQGKDDTVTKFRLGLDSTNGLQVQVVTSPIKAITFVTEGQDTWCYADMGEFGAVKFMVPVFSYTGGGFTGRGSFTQTKELKIPLTPLKLLLQACHLDAVANKIPRGLPLRECKIYDATTKHFDVDAFIQTLEDLGGFTLDNDIKRTLRAIEGQLDKLPDRFKYYLDVEIPKEFSFDIAVSADGRFQGNVTVDKSTPVKMLYPAIGPLGPQLNGIELYGFTVGEMLDGSLLLLNLDCRMDQFNLLTLIAALTLPLDKLPILPRTQDLITTTIVHNLFMLIIYETVIPIPVPLFFDELGLDYLGLEGLALQTHWRFPKPKLSMGDAAKIFSDFEKFFTDRSYLLDANTPPQNMDLVLTIGPNYIQLPKYLGSQMLGSKDDKTVVSSYANLAHLLNALKTLSLNEIVQALPLDRRVGKQQVLFACMTLEADWLITTPAEFRAISYKQLNIVDSAIDTMLQVVPPTPRQDEQGLVLLLKGVWSVANIASLEACFGLIATAEGFSTGMRVSGTLTDLLAVEMRGIVVINPHAADAFSLSGHSHLVVLGDDIFTGDLKLTENRFAIEGDLNLFPKWPALRITGHLTGHLSETELYIAGSAAVIVGGYFTLASASAEVTHTGIKIAGTWLQQTVTFVAQKVNDTVQLQATLSPITLGEVFKMTGVGTDPGPRATLGVSASNVPSLFLGGKIALLGVQVEGQVSFTEQGFSFVISGQIFSLFQATLTATGGDLLNGETFTITATMQNDLLEYLREHITTEIKAAADAATAQITADQDQIRQAQDRVNSLNSQIAAMRQTIQGERDRDAQRLRDAQQAVNNAQNQVSSLQSQIDYYNEQIDARNRDIADKQSWYDNSPWYEKTYRWAELSAYVSQKGAEITGLGTVLGGLYTAKAGAETTLRATEATLQGLEQTAKTTPIDLDPRMTGLYTAKAGADATLRTVEATLQGIEQTMKTAPIDLDPRMTGLYAARETANGTLELANKTLDAAKAAAGAWADVSAFIAEHTLGGLVNVTAASFTGQLNAVQGGNVTMKADLQLMNRPHTYTFSFAFHDPLSSVKALAQTIINDIANMLHS